MTQTPDAIHTHSTACWWNPDLARWVCARAAAQIPDVSEVPLVDVRDMLVVHTALLREFRLAPAAVRRVAAGSIKGAAMVERHLAFVCDLLHHHHQGEDDLLWPLLRQRVPAAAQAMIDQVESQHAGLDAALRAVAACRSGWTTEPGERRREALAAALEMLYGLLKTHLDLEEGAVLPLAAGVLTEAEWAAIGAAAAASMPKPDLVLAIGMFAYEGDPRVLRGMLAHAPVVARLLVPRIGPRVYAHRARQVHGDARP